MAALKAPRIERSCAVASLASEYEKLSDQLRAAIEADNHMQIEMLDKRISCVWDRIVDSRPTDRDGASKQAEFLIRHLIRSAPDSDVNKRIGQRLLQLVACGD